MLELARRKEILTNLLSQRENIIRHITEVFPQVNDYLEYCHSNIKNIIIILGSARGGTSVFKGVMSNFSNVISLPGEHRHLFTLSGQNFPDHGGDYEENSCWQLDQETITFLLRNMFYESHEEQSQPLTDQELELYGWDWACRLPLQWTDISFSPEKIVSIVRTFYRENELQFIKQNDLFLYNLIKRFEQNFEGIDCTFYDSPLVKLVNKEQTKQSLKTAFYKDRLIVEIPPFVLLKPRKLLIDFNHKNTLVIKASSDCYRIKQIDSLFKKFNKIYIHLKRNPLSSVNGLLDGWKHHTFGQHDLQYLEEMFKVSASSEIKLENSWKFDLFENWQSQISASLKDIAVSQWCHAHEKILKFKKIESSEWIDLFFEDFQGSTGERINMFRTIASRIEEMDKQLPLDEIMCPTIINATSKPSIQRWKSRRDQIVGILDNKKVVDICSELGYEIKNYNNWL